MTTFTRLRINAGLTQAAVARATGVPKSIVSRVELGNSARPENLKKLADFFGVTVVELLDVEDREAA